MPKRLLNTCSGLRRMARQPLVKRIEQGCVGTVVVTIKVQIQNPTRTGHCPCTRCHWRAFVGGVNIPVTVAIAVARLLVNDILPVWRVDVALDHAATEIGCGYCLARW